MENNRFFKVRLFYTIMVTLAIWSLLAWNYFHGGVPSHHLLARKDLPAISNWWGGLVLPVLTWFLLNRIKKRVIRNEGNPAAKNQLENTLYRFAAALLFGGVLAAFFSLGNQDMPGYMLLAVFPLALFFPLYRSECLLGFVLGMTFTFGGVLPTLIGSVLVLLCAVLYLYVRPAFLFVFSKLTGRHSKQPVGD